MTHPVKFVQAIRPSRAGSFLFPLILAGLLLPAATWAQVTYTGTAANQNFGSQAVGSTSTAKTLSFSIAAGTTVGSIAVVTQGAPNLDFTEATGSTCAAQDYASAATCTVNVTFTPKAAGARYGAVVFSDGSGNTLATTYVQGTGGGPVVTFVNTTSGAYSPSQQVMLGSGSIAPNCVAVDASGNLFITDGNDVKEILAVNGSIPASPTIRTLATGFSWPYCVAVDGSGNLFVADRGADAAKEIVAAGGYATVKTLASGLGGPNGVAVDGSGNVFVADWENSTVKEILAAGGYTTVKNLVGGSFSEADYVSVDGSGNLYVADFGNGAVKEILAAGGYTTVKTLASGLGCTSSVAVDAIGNLFVTDWCSGTASEIMAAGGYTTIHALSGGYTYLNSVAVDGSGNVFIPDGAHSRVVKLDYADPPSLTFANTPVGVESGDSPQTVAVSNVGNQALVLTALTYPTDFPEEAGGGADPCTGSTSLSPGLACDLNINFTPLSAGLLSESVILTDDALNVANATQSISLSGAGGQPIATLSAMSISFPNEGVGSVSLSQQVTLTNTGNLKLAITSIAVTGTNATSFAFGNTCGTNLAAGASCSIHGHFAPTTTGALSAAVTITDNAGDSPQSIALSGTGHDATTVTLSSPSVPFGIQEVGTSSASQDVTLTNTGGATLLIASIGVTGTDASSFVFANNCGTSLAAGASCLIHGHFTPTAAAAMTASVAIVDSAASSPHSIALSGTGFSAPTTVSLSATSIAFGDQAVGTASGSRHVILTNTGTTALAIASIAVTSADASSFVLGSTTTYLIANSCGPILAPGASCLIHGHFTPTATGALTAAVTIKDSATSSPQSISLTGTGQ